MLRILKALVVVTALTGFSNDASSQSSNAALGEAKARLACGTGTVVASQVLPNGSIQVTCSQSAPATNSTVLQGTGLTAPVAIGLLAVATVLVISTGGTDDPTTTTTTSIGMDFR